MIDFFDYKNNLTPAKGMLLISEPFLEDPNFDRTVILLCEHNEQGSFGFVINQSANISLKEVIEIAESNDQQLFVGGPVEHNTLHFIHRFPSLENGVEIINGLYWGGDFDQLLALIDTGQATKEDVKFFVGYSGWETDQLEEELKINSWIVSDIRNPDLLFMQEDKELWKKVLVELGGKFSIYSNYPSDPRLN
jgi:putative transcriptional regulator